jgi:hypothetical protein
MIFDADEGIVEFENALHRDKAEYSRLKRVKILFRPVSKEFDKSSEMSPSQSMAEVSWMPRHVSRIKWLGEIDTIVPAVDVLE